MKVWGVTDKGKVRKENQDAYHAEIMIVGDGEDAGACAVCVVCDGMGGARSGNIASSMAVEHFVRVVKSRLGLAVKVPELAELREVLAEAITEADGVILGRARSDPNCADMGTTLVAAIVRPDGRAIVVNIGDSRCYMLRMADGSIIQVTKDHSLVEDMIDRGELKREEARYHPNRNLITRAISADANTTPDFFELKLSDGDFLLLCSDGLSNETDPREIAFELMYGEPDSVAQRCLDIALGRGAVDNVTVVIINN